METVKTSILNKLSVCQKRWPDPKSEEQEKGTENQFYGILYQADT